MVRFPRFGWFGWTGWFGWFGWTGWFGWVFGGSVVRIGAVGQVVVRRRAEAYGARLRRRTAAERERAPDWAAAPDADKRYTASRRAGTVPPLVTWVFSEGWNALERLRGGRA
ncbi:hypothetical protein ACIP3B_09805 [Streptomyces anulatus]|uniref:hypothetical protein n=1 Tax=Streptomyces anulatus TaxID=1892 RepID=UPI0033CBB71F